MTLDSLTVRLDSLPAQPAQEVFGAIGIGVGAFFLVGLIGMLFGRSYGP